MERVKVITQKRTTLKTQITNLSNMITQNQVGPSNLILRFKKVTALFDAYEELQDELAIIDPGNEKLGEIYEIQNRYYELATRIQGLERPSTSRGGNSDTTSSPSSITQKPKLKLPVPELPSFDGQIENWISYRNSFLTMIDSRDDVDDLQKFIYLRSSLQTTALKNKISIYSVSAENYKNAWELLVDTYEKRRVLIAKHLDAILDLPTQERATSWGLEKLVDSMKQHVSMLKTLDIVPDEHLLTRIIERALPQVIRDKWEETLKLDEVPCLDQIYAFVAEAAYRLSSKNESRNKRRGSELDTTGHKLRNWERGTRVLVTSTSGNCVACKRGKHALFKCVRFKKLTLNRRWELVKATGVCKNCLARHGNNRCEYQLCNVCGNFHNKLLHNYGSGSTQSTSDRARSDEGKGDKPPKNLEL